MFHRFLTMLFEWFYRYPTDRPLLYKCEDKSRDVTALVRAEDFDAEIRRMRLWFQTKGYNSCVHVPRPQVYPIFLFSGNAVAPRNFLTGNAFEAYWMMEGCAVEERSFEIPPIEVSPHGRAFTPCGYGVSIAFSEEVGRAGSRVRSYTLDEAVAYLRRGKPLSDDAYWVDEEKPHGIKVRDLAEWEKR